MEKPKQERSHLIENFKDTFGSGNRNKSHEYIGNIQDNISEIIEEANKHFGHNTIREETYDVFNKCSSVIVVGGDYDVPMQKTEVFPYFDTMLQPLYNALQNFYGYETLCAHNVIISKLEPGCTIPIHKDAHSTFKHTHRCHMVLQADEGVNFYSVRRVIETKIGDIFELNNDKMYHSVVNNSTRSRYHIIVDCYEGNKGAEGLVKDRKGD